MIHIFPLLAIFIFCAPVQSHPVDWLRKFSNAAREDGSWLWGWAWASDGTVSVVDRSPAITFPARPASFGAELPDPLLGYVIPLSSFTAPCLNLTASLSLWSRPDAVLGCPDLCAVGPYQPDPTETWIALVQRGGCPFIEKARQAQRLGAKAVVVGGSGDSPDALLNMYSERDSSDVTIAATFIKYWDYVELLSMIANSNTTHAGLKTLSLLLSTEYSPWEWYSPIVTFVFILLLPSLLTFITLLIHRYRAARAAQRDRAPEDVVHNFPCRIWTGAGTGREKDGTDIPLMTNSFVSGPELEQGLTESPEPALEHASTSCDRPLPAWADEQVECAICLELFAPGDRIRVLPCYHIFHADEIDEWLIHKKKLCPVCKMDVTRPHPPANHVQCQPNPNTPQPTPDSVPIPAHSPISDRTPLLQDNSMHSYDTSS